MEPSPACSARRNRAAHARALRRAWVQGILGAGGSTSSAPGLRIGPVSATASRRDGSAAGGGQYFHERCAPIRLDDLIYGAMAVPDAFAPNRFQLAEGTILRPSAPPFVPSSFASHLPGVFLGDAHAVQDVGGDAYPCASAVSPQVLCASPFIGMDSLTDPLVAQDQILLDPPCAATVHDCKQASSSRSHVAPRGLDSSCDASIDSTVRSHHPQEPKARVAASKRFFRLRFQRRLLRRQHRCLQRNFRPIGHHSNVDLALLPGIALRSIPSSVNSKINEGSVSYLEQRPNSSSTLLPEIALPSIPFLVNTKIDEGSVSDLEQRRLQAIARLVKAAMYFPLFVALVSWKGVSAVEPVQVPPVHSLQTTVDVSPTQCTKTRRSTLLPALVKDALYITLAVVLAAWKDLYTEHVLEEDEDLGVVVPEEGESTDAGDTAFYVGDRVQVHGLVSAAGAALNNEIGLVVSALVEGRVGVSFAASGAPKALKPSSLRRLPH